MGAEPVRLGKPKKHRGKVSGGAVALVIVLSGFVFLSYRPVMRLRSNPPTSFLETRKEWDAKRRTLEERAARAYWQQALEVIQVKYEFGAPLPTEPPLEFSIEKKGFPRSSPEGSPSTRARYWERLRVVWNSPQAWEKSYGWSTVWVRESLVSFEAAIHRLVGSIFGEFST